MWGCGRRSRPLPHRDHISCLKCCTCMLCVCDLLRCNAVAVSRTRLLLVGSECYRTPRPGMGTPSLAASRTQLPNPLRSGGARPWPAAVSLASQPAAERCTARPHSLCRFVWKARINRTARATTRCSLRTTSAGGCSSRLRLRLGHNTPMAAKVSYFFEEVHSKKSRESEEEADAGGREIFIGLLCLIFFQCDVVR